MFRSDRFDLTRRDLLKLTSVGVLGTGVSGWFDVLAARAGEAARQGRKHKSCILLFMNGGPAQSHTFDLKECSEYKAIDTAVPGIKISETGEDAEYKHTVGGHTDSGYTSWSTEQSIAEEFGREATVDADADAERGYHDEQDAEEDAEWRGRIIILRVRIADVLDQMEPGEEREDEWRLRGHVEGVEICEGDEDDEE